MLTPDDRVTADHIMLCYLVFLGRPAESEEIVQHHVSKVKYVKELGEYFMSTEEFKSKVLDHRSQLPLTSRWVDNDTFVSPEDLKKMISHVEADWSTLGNTEPHWSVLTHNNFKQSNLSENISEFYATGKDAVHLFSSALSRAGITLDKNMTCLELGCGVGRITIWLSEIFKKVIAVDISNNHLNIAKAALAERSIGNVETKLLGKIEDIDAFGSFDAFFSIIVLQHNPPPVIYTLMKSILNRLNRGGIAYFQVPTYSRKPFNARNYLRDLKDRGEMEVHAIAQKELFGLISAENCVILDIREDGWTGDNLTLSNSILLRKQ